jgi:hypothetical protein
MAEVRNQTAGTLIADFSYVNVQTFPTDDSANFLDPFGNTMSNYFQQASDTTAAAASDLNAGLSIEQRQAILKDADAYEKYTLIRLPTEFGGARENVTSFRAYSDLDPESHCLLLYEHRNVSPTNAKTITLLEDPCHSDRFRVTDGYSCVGHIAIGINPVVSEYNALPRMRLAVDNQGYLLAIKPDGMPSGDGIVGDGRILSSEDIASDADPTCKNLFGR